MASVSPRADHQVRISTELDPLFEAVHDPSARAGSIALQHHITRALDLMGRSRGGPILGNLGGDGNPRDAQKLTTE
jgi:hypothetical protein